MELLKIDPEFRDKIPPLTAEEFAKLEENIVADGEVREPLVVWHDTIVDGHHRWEIIQRHPDIPYKVKRMDFANRWAAIVWMCKNQLGRRNLTDEQRAYTIGKMYEAQKMSVGGNGSNQYTKKQCTQSGNIAPNTNRVSERIADEIGVGKNTVIRAERFSKSLDEAEAISPGIRNAVLTGEVKVPRKIVAQIHDTPEPQRGEIVEAIRKGDTPEAKRIIMEMNPPREPEKRETFTIEMMCEQLDASMDNLDAVLKMDLVTNHRDMLNTPDNRKKALEVLHHGISVIQKYVEMIRRIEEDD